MYDVVIAGARCAGSPLAILLARAGFRVCLVDRASFPSETPSTHVIQPHGVAILNELGVLDGLLGAGGVPLTHFTMADDDVRIEATAADPGLCVRRVTLDALLVAAAERAGAEVRTGCRVTGVLRNDSGRVGGIATAAGPIRASLTIGADGRRSTIASAVGAAEYLVTPQGRTPAWAYFSGVGDREPRLRIGRQGDLAFLASPTDGGLYMAGIALPPWQVEEFHADRIGRFAAAVEEWPELACLLRGAERVGPIRVFAEWHGYFRPSAGPGWALVGDAGHFKDFTPAQGISDALRQATALADAIAPGLDDSLDERLRHWWRWRDRDAHDMYGLAQDMGVPGRSTPLVSAVLGEIAGSTVLSQRFLRVLDHQVPPSALFTPRVLATATLRALVGHPRRVPATLREVGRAVGDAVRRWLTRPAAVTRLPICRTFRFHPGARVS